MLDDAAGARRGACAAVTNVRDRDLADQVDNQSLDFVSAHIGTLPMGHARSQRRVTTLRNCR